MRPRLNTKATHERDSPGTRSGTRGIRAVLRPRWRALLVLAAVSVLTGFLEAAFLIAITRLAFGVAEGADEVSVIAGMKLSIGEATLLALGFVLLRLVATTAQVWLSARLGTSVIARVRRDLSSAFLNASWSTQQKSGPGRLQELLTTFSSQTATLIGNTSGWIRSSFNLAALLVTAVVVDAAASVIVIGVLALLGLVLRPIRAAIKRQAGATSRIGMDFATSVGEVSQLGMEIQVFGVQSNAQARVDRLIRRHNRTHRRLRLLQGLIPGLYTTIAYVAVVVAVAAATAIDTADLESVGAVTLIMMRSLGYGQAVQNASASIVGTAPFLDTLQDELQSLREARAGGGTTPVADVCPLSVENVWFEYVEDTPVLKDVNFSLKQGEMIGIVGPSGGGKTTLVQLLLGLRQPTQGTITADGVPLAELDKSEWIRKVTFVPQQPHFFDDTVAENIRFLRDYVSDDAVRAAARLAHIHDDIVGWPQGYEQPVGPGGSNLSGGQQQRLIIARALAVQPQLLILDEPTSALDTETESLIRSTLDGLRGRVAVVVIAHRLSTLESCDRIMVIQDGELKAFDTPANLERSSDFYREALALSGMR